MSTRRPLTPADVLSFKNIEDPQISPAGDCVAFVSGDSFKADGALPASAIWVVDTAGGTPRRLTSGPRSDNLPRWSPDGRSLAFLSDRIEDGQRQVFCLPGGGGEAVALTEVEGAIPSPRGLNALQWSPDGRFLAFLMEDSQSAAERQRREDGDDAIEFEQKPQYLRLWQVEVETRQLRCLSPEGLQIWEFAWSPDGAQVAAVASDLPYEWSWYQNRLVCFAPGGPARTLWQTTRQVALPVWAPDGMQLAFISSTWSDRGCVAGDVWLVDADGGEARCLTAGQVASSGWMAWLADGDELLTIDHERGGVGMHRIRVEDGHRTDLWWQLAAVSEAAWPRFSHAADGTLAVVLEDSQNPRDIWVGRPQAAVLQWNQLTRLHPQAAEIAIGATVVHHWKGAGGLDMQGLLIQPVGYEPGTRCPLVMSVHGGPTGVSCARYNGSFGWCQLLANQGYAVFLPNFRGSVGWGVEFSESNLGDMGGRDFEDMMLGIDSLIEAGVADPARLAISGWSYGGFVAAWAVSQTDRFSAAVMGAGISHWLSFHGKTSLATWDQLFYQTSPYEKDGLFQHFSPLSYAQNLQTPTLILHGEQDQDVPVEQSYLFFRALKDRDVPTELIVYPREAHGITEKAHMLDMAERVSAWLGRYLGPKESL